MVPTILMITNPICVVIGVIFWERRFSYLDEAMTLKHLGESFEVTTFDELSKLTHDQKSFAAAVLAKDVDWVSDAVYGHKIDPKKLNLVMSSKASTRAMLVFYFDDKFKLIKMKSGCCALTPTGYVILGHVLDFPTVGTVMVLVINGMIYRAVVENLPAVDAAHNTRESIYYSSTLDGAYEAAGNSFGNGMEAGAYLSKPFVGVVSQMTQKGKNNACGFSWYSHNSGELSTSGNSGTAYRTPTQELGLHHGKNGNVALAIVPSGNHPRSIKLEAMNEVKDPLLQAYIEQLSRPHVNAVKGVLNATQSAPEVKVNDFGSL